MTSGKINFYDEDKESYERFWDDREYEHRAELVAIHRLLGGRHFHLALDYGGGYGRLTPALLEFADKVILVDPSTKQLGIAQGKLKNANVEFKLQTIKDNVPAEDNSIDLVLMVRVSHHLPEPRAVLSEIGRVLKPGGTALIEIASNADFVNRLRYLKHLKGIPKNPVTIGSRANGAEDDTPFVNNNPKTIKAVLSELGLRVERSLSVSNLRSPTLKKHLPLNAMLTLEKAAQGPLSHVFFGPSIFLLVVKAN